MNEKELIIKIPEDEYEWLTNREKFYALEKSTKEWLINRTLNRVLNGTSLPKCHGRKLILSEDAVKQEQVPLSFSSQNWISETSLSKATLTIIEADEEEKCVK